MIILITGASHTGKTLLAQKMLEKYKYPYLSIDHLKMGLIRSGNTELTPEDDEALTGYLWPIIREIVKTAIENKQNLIIEGCYIPFDWRRDFEERYLSSIRFICVPAAFFQPPPLCRESLSAPRVLFRGDSCRLFNTSPRPVTLAFPDRAFIFYCFFSVNVNSDPMPTSLLTVMSPPISWVRSLAMDRPRPVPSVPMRDLSTL